MRSERSGELRNSGGCARALRYPDYPSRKRNGTSEVCVHASLVPCLASEGAGGQEEEEEEEAAKGQTPVKTPSSELTPT